MLYFSEKYKLTGKLVTLDGKELIKLDNGCYIPYLAWNWKLVEEEVK